MQQSQEPFNTGQQHFVHGEKSEPVADSVEPFQQKMATDHQADDESNRADYIDDRAKIIVTEQFNPETQHDKTSIFWQVLYINDEFDLRQRKRYSSIEQINQAIEEEKRRLEELSREDPKQVELSVVEEKMHIETEQAKNNNMQQDKEAEVHYQKQVESVDKIMISQQQQSHHQQVPQQNPHEHNDQFQQTNKTVKSTVVEESSSHTAQPIQYIKSLESKNAELLQKFQELQQQMIELKRLSEEQKKEDNHQQKITEVNLPQLKNNQKTLIASNQKKIKKKWQHITDNRLKKILEVIEAVDRSGKPVKLQLPERNQVYRKGPVFQRDFKLDSNIYNIAVGEILDLDKTYGIDSLPESSNAIVQRPIDISPKVNIPKPSTVFAFHMQSNNQSGLTLESLEKRGFQLETELHQINQEIQKEHRQKQTSHKNNTATRYYSSAMNQKDNQKMGTEMEQSISTSQMYWHSFGKRATFQLERSEAGKMRKTREYENPELIMKIDKHRSRPASVRQKVGDHKREQPKEVLRNLKDKNQQENEDKAIQTPQIILTPDFKVTLKNLMFPVLPGKPQPYHVVKDLTELGTKTFICFGIPLDESHVLTVKKFKNCVLFRVFDINIVWYYQGKFYIGGWRENGVANEGEKQGHAIELIPNKYLYEGDFYQGRRHGYGKIKYQNGDYYEGQWSKGVKQGTGKLAEVNGVLYEGQMRDGRQDGIGKLIISPLQIYEGGFVRGIKNGHGKEHFKTGDSYEGDYVLGKFSGEGCYRWANGAMYNGQFHNGCRNGKGYWRLSDNTPCDTYDGSYQNDKKCGWGLYTWQNGVSYEGNFMNDLRQGEGTVKYPNGKTIKAIWENGTRKQELSNQEKEDYKMARKRAEPANLKAGILPRV